MSIREEIKTEASKRFGNQGYGQDDLLDVAFEVIEKKIDSVLEEQSKYHEDYAEGLNRLQRMLK